MHTLRIEWDNNKNALLKETRDICFEDVERAIIDDQILDIVPHFNKKHAHQQIIVLLLHGYTHYVPFVQDKEKIFFKTIIPSRKLHKIYNVTQKDEKE
jgi:uncharacterized DUF497 family protein